MKKTFYIILICIIFASLFLYTSKDNGKYKILGYEDAAHLYLDLNKNNQIEENELVDIKDCIPVSVQEKRTPNLNLTPIQKLYLEYKFKEWADKNLINKKVILIKDNDDCISFYIDNIDYRIFIIKNGFAQTDNKSLLKNIKIDELKNILTQIEAQNYVVVNLKSNKYHKLDCPLIAKLHNYKIVPFIEVKGISTPCKLCHSHKKHNKSHHFNYKIYPTKYPSSYSIDNIFTIFFINFNNLKHPYNDCKIPACKALQKEINEAQRSIDFAVYGIQNEPQILNALIKAQKRGVNIRWVTDYTPNNDEYYKDNEKVMKLLPLYNTDKTSTPSAIMHNKFFIFDNKKVWTGSANLTSTDLSNFNANYVALINSPQVSAYYKAEFEKMYNGTFHKAKSHTSTNYIYLNKSLIVKPLFSPKASTTENIIIPIIDNAKSYIFMPIFFLTDKRIAEHLISAKVRGVDIKIIMDATNANGKYSLCKTLRLAKIPTKVENKAGKMHMKAIIADDKYSIIGSMNYTKSGNQINDENTLVIENSDIAKYLKGSFLIMWNSIPEKYLYLSPSAESFASIGSCNDGIDNDFDGKTDNLDEGCFPFSKK
ncbi:MAG: phospholipase D-like domain-containing protein [Candidatus Gastranaerophilales bacterium]|nr:phospholipase D-like domain-containing protein [Candidatus Gastranaerophilales bacterium]